MRKAFDANVPKLKPRLGRAMGTEGAPTGTATSIPTATPTSTPTPISIPPAPEDSAVHPERSADAEASARSRRAPTPTADQAPLPLSPRPAEAGAPESDVLSRKERLDKIKRRVAEAARPQPRAPVVPADPARAAESVLGLVRDLEAELVRAREREEALRGDLDEARRELARTAGEGRSAVERLTSAEKELDEKRGVLRDLLGEMQALEEERDASVRRAQALATLDEERAKLLEDLGRRGDEEARLRAEREAEVERLSEELRLSGTDGARLRAAVGELARERDQLGADLDRVRRERDDLAEAKRALEAVHAALAQARARIG